MSPREFNNKKPRGSATGKPARPAADTKQPRKRIALKAGEGEPVSRTVTRSQKNSNPGEKNKNIYNNLPARADGDPTPERPARSANTREKNWSRQPDDAPRKDRKPFREKEREDRGIADTRPERRPAKPRDFDDRKPRSTTGKFAPRRDDDRDKSFDGEKKSFRKKEDDGSDSDNKWARPGKPAFDKSKPRSAAGKFAPRRDDDRDRPFNGEKKSFRKKDDDRGDSDNKWARPGKPAFDKGKPRSAAGKFAPRRDDDRDKSFDGEKKSFRKKDDDRGDSDNKWARPGKPAFDKGKPRSAAGKFAPRRDDDRDKSFDGEKKSFRKKEDDRSDADNKWARPGKPAFDKGKPRSAGKFGPRHDDDRDKPFDREKKSFGKRAENERSFERKRNDDSRRPRDDRRDNKKFDNADRPAKRTRNFDDDKDTYSKAPRRSNAGKSAAEPAEEQLMPLNKYMAHSGVASRRDAAQLVKEGKVKVNGELITDPGHKVLATDLVTYNDGKLTLQKGLVYILLNKPKDFITTTDDPQGRRTVMDLLTGQDADRLYPVGRLDRQTTGLLLITNDGMLAQKLSHPAHEIKKVYQVTLDKPLTKAHFEKIMEGLELEDGKILVDAMAYLEKKNELGLEIHSGRNRIVRRIFESLGYEVEKLDRVMYAGLTKKNLPRGKWRYLNDTEILMLRHFKS